MGPIQMKRAGPWLFVAASALLGAWLAWMVPAPITVYIDEAALEAAGVRDGDVVSYRLPEPVEVRAGQPIRVTLKASSTSVVDATGYRYIPINGATLAGVYHVGGRGNCSGPCIDQSRR